MARLDACVLFAAIMLAAVACSRTPPSVAAMTEPAVAPAPAARDTGDPARGLHVATRLGCNGCHGDNAAGQVFIDKPEVGRVVAPNLTQRRHAYDATTFAALLREGRTPTGRPPLGMPIFMFQHLSDQEVRDVWAWLQALPDTPNAALPATEYAAPIARAIADGTLPYLDDVRADPGNAPPAVPPTERLALGKHLAMTTCSECHGRDLDGFPGDDAPGLVVAKAYDAARFARLMKTGITASGKPSKSGLMSEIAVGRLSSLTDAEVDALKAYLDAR